MLLILVGTKAQYIKTAPVLLELDKRRLPYRLVYTGQHFETFAELESQFGTRAADENWVPGAEADTKISFTRWTLRFWKHAWDTRRQRWRVHAGMMMVHGDTASTLYGALLARLDGWSLCHVEAGLRSDRLLDPFPEEAIRRIVSRLSSLHFAPDAASAANLRNARGQVVDTGGNTLLDALAHAMRNEHWLPAMGGLGGYAVVSLHRNENLSRLKDFELLMREIVHAAQTMPVRFVLHPATRARLASTGWDRRLEAVANLALLPRSDHLTFLKLLVDASCLLTDGGSNQEEAAMLGLPCLLLRRRTERSDGLGNGVEISHLDPAIIRRFVSEHRGKEWALRPLGTGSPSARIVDALESADVFAA